MITKFRFISLNLFLFLAEEFTKENLDEEYDENMDEENLDDEMNVKPSGNSNSNKDKSDSPQQLIRCSRCFKLLRRKSEALHSKLCKVKYLIPIDTDGSNFQCISGIIEMDSILSINNTICTVIHNNNEFSITLDKHKNREGVFLIELHQTIDQFLRIKLKFNFGNFKILTKDLSLQRKVGKLVIPNKCTNKIVKFKVFVQK